MLRGVIALTMFAALVGAVGIGRASLGTSAQEGTADLAGHPLVGTWMAMAPDGASPETFYADGSFVGGPPIIVPGDGAPSYLGPAIGVWESTGERSGHATFVQALGDATGTYTGTLTIDAHLQVSEDGNSFVDDSPETTITIRDPRNNVVAVIHPYADAGSTVAPVTGIRMSPGNPGFPEAVATPTA